MSEQKIDSTQATQSEPVNTSRRKLTAAALAGPVVLGSLASKQALGAVPYHCTVSGQVSNTDSVRPNDSTSCANLGLSPGCWKKSQSPNIPVWTTVTRTMTFNSVFGVDFHGATLIQVLCAQGYGASPNPIPHGAANADLARAGVASILNAYKVGALSSHDNYPVTVSEIINLVYSILKNGIDLISQATAGRVATVGYLASLYGGTAGDVDSGNVAQCPFGNPALTAAETCS
jgi:hypothetical protein